MAEEKKEKTTKKTTKEVKVEKKFCTKCGKELTGDEVCTCEEAISVNTEALANVGKRFINTILNMYKKPATTLKEEVEKKDFKNSILILVAIAISFGLYFTGGFNSILQSLNLMGNNYDFNSIVNIPYFKIFIYMTLIYFIVAFIPVLIAWGLARFTGNKEFDFKKSLSLYATSMAPTIFTNLLMAILYYLNILSWIGAIIGAIISLACFFHYILGLLDVLHVREDRKSYILTVFIVAWIVVVFIVIMILAGSLYSDIIKETVNSNYPTIWN